MTDLETRLRSAVQAETAAVEPEEGSLDTIRARVRTAHRRRAVVAGIAAVALVGVALAVPRLGDDGRVTTSDEPPGTTADTPTTAPPQTSTTAPGEPTPAAPNLDQVLWPSPEERTQGYADPQLAVDMFAESFWRTIGPPTSETRMVEPGVAEIDVYHSGEDLQSTGRVATTVVLRQLGDETWWITALLSDEVQVDSPEPLAEVSSPVRVAGRGHGYEGTVTVELRHRAGFAPDNILAQDVTIAGAGEALEPFSVDLPLGGSLPRVAVVVAQNDAGIAANVPATTAFPVLLGSGESSSGGGQADEFGYQPLWPFRTQAEADQWRDQYQAQGSQPWHLDAEQTALSFTTGYLGFTEVNRVVGSDVRDREAWVSVGYETNPGQFSTSADIHLVRFGSGADAPWEVVGTRDTDLTVEQPRYGTGVTSPVTVGGHITGVDENLRVQVRQISSEAPIGEACCLPAGDVDSPWQTTVSFAGATDPALTIVVSTGGHFQGVERFAITGVRP
jgi:hypothetical protein